MTQFINAVLEQRKWRAECQQCPFADTTAAATVTGPRHSRNTGHTVDVEVIMSGRFTGGIAE